MTPLVRAGFQDGDASGDSVCVSPRIVGFPHRGDAGRRQHTLQDPGCPHSTPKDCQKQPKSQQFLRGANRTRPDNRSCVSKGRAGRGPGSTGGNLEHAEGEIVASTSPQTATNHHVDNQFSSS